MGQSAIQRICDTRGLRQSWLAKQLGVSKWLFSHIEAGRRPAPAGYYERAAQVLGVPVDMVRPEPAAEEVPA